MRGVKNKLLLACMLLLVAAGASMPRITAALQDRSLEVQTESRDLDGVELTLGAEGGVRQVLTLLSSEHTGIKLDGGANLTEEEAQKAAVKAMTLLTQEKLLSGFDPEDASVSAAAFVVVPDGGAFSSAVVWECVYADLQGQVCTVVIDDATEKLVSISLYGAGKSNLAAPPPRDREVRFVLAERWITFLAEEYGFEAPEFRETYYGGGVSQFELDFIWGRQEEKTHSRLPLSISENGFSFNRWFRFRTQAVSIS